MKLIFLACWFALSATAACGQLELTTGYAVNRNLADGAPLHIAYDLQLGNRWFTKPQIGFKYLKHYNDFVGATMKVRVWEFHQTLSYEVVKKEAIFSNPISASTTAFTSGKGKCCRRSTPYRAGRG